MSTLVLLRHGETEWTRSHQHTGRTDIALTVHGEEQARAAGAALQGRSFVLTLVSPLARATTTADLAGLSAVERDADLLEWDYGRYEGRRTADIEAERPGWNLWADGPAGGETVEEVGARADRVLARVRPAMSAGDVCLVGHGHQLRVLAARYLGLPPDRGALLRLDTATLSELGLEHERPVVVTWNVRATPLGRAAAATD